MPYNKTRAEHDSMGSVDVDSKKLWGAQTQRATQNFYNQTHTLHQCFLVAYLELKKACATANRETNTEYDTLIWEWRTLYQQDSDIQRIELELMDANRQHDGIQE